MALLSLQDVSLAYGGPRLFDSINLQLEAGERVALLGRNGTGKSTLMRVMAQHVDVDAGHVIWQRGIHVAHLTQEIPDDLSGPVFDIVLSGLGEQARLVADFHAVSHQLETEQNPALMRKLGTLQEKMDQTNGWEIDRQVEQIIQTMGVEVDRRFEELSGGQKRRVLLAKAIIRRPEVLLLDEPTNHLDMSSIEWLEQFLKDYEGTIFFVTHDRMFMNNLANRIMELDRGKLYSWTCDYETFLKRRQEALEVEASQRAEFDKKLSQEEAWIRKGIRARRTRNEGRVRALEQMREERKARRDVVGKVRMNLQSADRSGQRVIKARNIRFHYDDTCIIDNFSTEIMRGDKIGVIGPNGSGKTTLLNILLGKLAPKGGDVEFGTNLKITYFDQLREKLDGDKTVLENVSDSDTIRINGRSRHVMGYLQEFLFSPERARTPVRILSGGERNRLLLAKLFTHTTNVLVMDEPTNDLDVETLELLEELLIDFSGTLLLVSHDRTFLNNVVTSTIAIGPEGRITEHVGGYDDWLREQQAKPGQADESPDEMSDEDDSACVEKRPLTYDEQRELRNLPRTIEKLERKQNQILETMATPEFFQRDPADIQAVKQDLESVEDELLGAFERWEFLENLKS